MSKNYFPLLTALLVVAIVVSLVALIRSFSSKSVSTPAQPVAVQSDITTSTAVLGTETEKPSPTPAFPPIIINNPIENSSTSAKIILVSGQTATSAAVTINDKSISTDKSGNFQTSLKLSPGPNLLVVTASDSGQKNIWQTIITLNSPASTPAASTSQ